jgi:uncharacterized delta-60 repeat protein
MIRVIVDSNRSRRPISGLAPAAAPIRYTFGILAMLIVITGSTLAFAQAGTLDSTFGTGGIFSTSFTQPAAADNAIAIQSDGKIILGGLVPLSGGGAVAALLRLNINGTLDTSFGTGGIVTSDFGITDGAIVFGIAIQPNGQIVAAAEGGFLDDGSVGSFNTDGSVDTTFGTNGFAVSNSINSAVGATNAMALQPNGSILVTAAASSDGTPVPARWIRLLATTALRY